MLTLLKIRNVALIDDLTIEFGQGLNLLTGETGSGKSIIVDSLGALIGERVSSDIVKHGSDSAQIEGSFRLEALSSVADLLASAGIGHEGEELIVRREISVAGRNRVFVNDQLVTQGFLKQLGQRLADIHGQGEQASLYDTGTHLAMLDSFAGVDSSKAATADAYRKWAELRSQLAALAKDESEKLQLADILKFQIDEIARASLTAGEDVELEEEKRRLNNVEKLSALSAEAHALLRSRALGFLR